MHVQSLRDSDIWGEEKEPGSQQLIQALSEKDICHRRKLCEKTLASYCSQLVDAFPRNNKKEEDDLEDGGLLTLAALASRD